MTSAVLFRTCSASVWGDGATGALTSTLPAGIPRVVESVQSGLRSTSHERFGTTFLISYGPTPGGGVFERFFIAVPCGTKPADGNASRLVKAPYGVVRWIVILPVASSVTMPEMSFAL